MSLISLSKHLLTMEVRATGFQSFKQVPIDFFSTDTMLDLLNRVGTVVCSRQAEGEVENVSKNTSLLDCAYLEEKTPDLGSELFCSA